MTPDQLDIRINILESEMRKLMVERTADIPHTDKGAQEAFMIMLTALTSAAINIGLTMTGSYEKTEEMLTGSIPRAMVDARENKTLEHIKQALEDQDHEDASAADVIRSSLSQ
jgi:hypothetical protein